MRRLSCSRVHADHDRVHVGCCATIEGGFRYEYDGRVLPPWQDPAKSVSCARPHVRAEAPDLPDKPPRTA